METQQSPAQAGRSVRPPSPAFMPEKVVKHGEFNGEGGGGKRWQFGDLFQRRQRRQLHQNAGQSDGVEA